MTAAMAPARGALVDRDRHPEVRQFLILAALKRASELSRLRDLPDLPVRSEDPPETAKVAGLPAERTDAEPEEAAPVNETPECQHSNRNRRAVFSRVARRLATRGCRAG